MTHYVHLGGGRHTTHQQGGLRVFVGGGLTGTSHAGVRLTHHPTPPATPALEPVPPLSSPDSSDSVSKAPPSELGAGDPRSSTHMMTAFSRTYFPSCGSRDAVAHNLLPGHARGTKHPGPQAVSNLAEITCP